MNKLDKLKNEIRKLESAVVAFSGGVDSSFLLKIVRDTLPKKNILAVTATSETYTKEELDKAKKFTRKLGIKHNIVSTNELKDKNFNKNPTDRCYYCKKELFGRLTRIVKEKKLKTVIDASNYDDRLDYRPGSIAKKEFKVISPLMEAKLTKQDIRIYSKRLKLKTWDEPSMACLASRIPYGEKIEKTTLKKINLAESYIRKQGIKEVRVRCHDSIARIEVGKKDIKRFVKKSFCDKIIKHLKTLGFRYIALDLEGYRTGSMNEVLK
ncbi:MAG: ATP-dependent sacrificial sulfur transferase LarE [Candidatus Omnitrophota bacterium]